MHVVKRTLDQGWDIDIVADRDGLQSDWNDCYFNDAALQREWKSLECRDARPLVIVLQDAEVVMSQCCQCLRRVRWLCPLTLLHRQIW